MVPGKCSKSEDLQGHFWRHDSEPYHLGWAYEETNRRELARQHFEQVLKVSSNYPATAEIKKELAHLKSQATTTWPSVTKPGCIMRPRSRFQGCW